MATNTAAYSVGHQYKSTARVSQARFESKDATKGYNRSVILERGLIDDPLAVSKCISVVNLSGQNQAVEFSAQKPYNPHYGDQRFNHKILESVVVDRGRSIHFTLHPKNFHLSIKQTRLDTFGQVVNESRLGYEFASLENQVLSISDDISDGSLVGEPRGYANVDNYFEMENNAHKPIIAYITKDRNVFAPTPQQVLQMRDSRITDRGAKLVTQATIKPGAKWLYKRPPNQVYVRIMTTNKNVSEEFVPSTQDYVEECIVLCKVGHIAVIFGQDDGTTRVCTYAPGELKFVDPSLAIDERDDD